MSSSPWNSHSPCVRCFLNLPQGCVEFKWSCPFYWMLYQNLCGERIHMYKSNVHRHNSCKMTLTSLSTWNLQTMCTSWCLMRTNILLVIIYSSYIFSLINWLNVHHVIKNKLIIRALTLSALCLKFLCVVGLKHWLSNLSQGSAKFMSHDGVTKLGQKMDLELQTLL